jgi:hypothetical protein
MSYTIEYNRKIYKEEDEKWEPNYTLLIKEGDNNVRDAKTNLRVSNWELKGYGWNYEIIQEICKRAGYCEGGDLQRAKGWNTENITPEEYLALYRKAIKQAKPIEKMFEDFIVEVILYRKENFTDTEKETFKWEIQTIDKLITKYQNEWVRGHDYYSPEIKTYRKEVKNLQEYHDFLEAPRWEHSPKCYCSWIFTERK